jgi:hypothetical protein
MVQRMIYVFGRKQIVMKQIEWNKHNVDIVKSKFKYEARTQLGSPKTSEWVDKVT